MRRLATLLLILCALAGHGRDQSLLAFCADRPPASGNWYDGLGLTEVWTLDQGTGATVVGGVAGTVGTISGAAWGQASGLNALWFDGTNDTISCGDALDIGESNLCIAAWINIARPSAAYQGILSKYQATTNRWLVGLNTGNGLYTALQLGTLVNGRTAGGGPLVTNEWMHIAWHVNRLTGFAASYTNGIASTSGTGAITTGDLQNASSLIIGHSASLGYYQGWLRDITIKHGCTNGFQQVIYNASKSRYGK